MLSKIKLALRISHTALDSDITEMIEACKLDLKRIGLINIVDTDFLIIQAVKLYVKWQLNFEGEAERYMNAYTALAQSLSLSGDYNV